ncbi:HAD family hydrolase [Bacillus sp. FJAT-49736]|uniref:Cof-type HAD-IIB family hydrolase n=1 Tax=Bacillus sp. FJAT-49736 TaxID=2833582 RepID=UPI001BCA4F18|nr:HAD family hydrolase [Bacillus sp. FJAT-49736]MBS4172925.1 HAD family phosphatase [Bacillus sp. FJAT-49736]
MKHYKILFLDIDGTIMRPDDTIEASTKKAIMEVRRQGIEVFLATGRPLHEISDIAAELDINSYIGYNGAYAILNGKDIVKEAMDSSLVENYLQIAKQHQHEIVFYTSEQNAFTDLDSPYVVDFIKRFHLQYNVPYSPSIANDILGITLIHLKEHELELYQQEGIHLSQVNVEGMRHCYDVIRHKVNKGFAVQKILEHLQIPTECAIAFGDGMNDKEMLQFVGEGFAMGNAHPDLFAYAKHKTTEVTNSGIYNGLKSLGLIQ